MTTTASTTQDSKLKTQNSELRTKISEAMERLHVPGVSVGIMVDGEEHVETFGVTNVDHPLPVTADTLFQIGSTTKTVTATAIMRLVEQGKLDLDAPVRTYLPDLRLQDESVAERVTVRQLLTHTAGWTGDFFADMGRGEDALARIVAAMAEIEQVTPLGEVWSYNNAAFYLAGRVIEAVTGQAYETATRELVLEPLGMASSYFFAEEVMVHSFAVGHHVADGEATVTTPWNIPRTAHPAGGIISTAGDQLRYARFHMGDGTAEDGSRVLSPAAIALMQAPAVEAAENTQMGLSWHIRTVEGTKLVSHGGSTNGQQSSFFFAPERGFALTVLTNADPGAALAAEIGKWALEKYLGIREPEPVHQERTAEELAEYAGAYHSAVIILTLRPENGRLMLDLTYTDKVPFTPPPPPPPIPLAFYGDDRIIALEGELKNARGEFLRDASGKIAWLRLGSRVHTRVSQ